MFLVIGIPGKTGSATARALLQRGAQVSVLARSEEKAASLKAEGATVIAGSLEDVADLTEAMRGKQGAFLMTPPPSSSSPDVIADRKKVVDGYAAAVKASGIPHVVYLSSIGGEHSRGTGLILTNHNGELALRGTSPNLTILRPPSFIENWSASASPAKDQGVLPSFFTAGRNISHIATEDVGRFAAEALLNPAQGERIWYLDGPRQYTPEEIAAVFGEVLGKPIQLQSIPDSQASAALQQYGAGKSLADGYQEMTQGINSGLIAIPEGVEVRRGSTEARAVIAEFFPKESRAAG